MTAPSTATDLSIPRSAPLCQRCGNPPATGTFETFNDRQVCSICAAYLRYRGESADLAEQARRRPGSKVPPPGLASKPLWTVGYLWLVGLIFGAALPGVLAAVNWQRLGEPIRARVCMMIAAVAAAAQIVAMMTLSTMREQIAPFFLGINLGALVWLTRGLGERVYAHLEAGGEREGTIWPIMVYVTIVFSVALAVTLVLMVVAPDLLPTDPAALTVPVPTEPT